ncbi:hypothetical protein IG631_03311 [Alternaria alternata]|nr:hypothetical protein IG631_03311 [Alternaria alternata]
MRVIVPCCVPPYESRTKPALDSSCLGRLHTHDCRFIDFQKASTQSQARKSFEYGNIASQFTIRDPGYRVNVSWPCRPAGTSRRCLARRATATPRCNMRTGHVPRNRLNTGSKMRSRAARRLFGLF